MYKAVLYATMLANQSIISQDEAEAIIKGLKEIQKILMKVILNSKL